MYCGGESAAVLVQDLDLLAVLALSAVVEASHQLSVQLDPDQAFREINA